MTREPGLHATKVTACVVLGCTNAVVRVYEHKENARVPFGVCAFHGQAIIKYGTDKQVRDYLFPGTETVEQEPGLHTTKEGA